MRAGTIRHYLSWVALWAFLLTPLTVMEVGRPGWRIPLGSLRLGACRDDRAGRDYGDHLTPLGPTYLVGLWGDGGLAAGFRVRGDRVHAKFGSSWLLW